MTAKSLCRWIRAAVLLAALCGLVFCAVLLPAWAGRPTVGGHFYEQDIDELKRGVDEIWRLLRLSLLRAR